MKLLTLIIFLLPCFCLCQITHKQIRKKKAVEYKSIQFKIVLNAEGTKTWRGTGFFIEYHKQLFFVTNYHGATGRWWEDTTRLIIPSAFYTEPSWMTLTLYSDTKKEHLLEYYDLLDSAGKRKYKSLPVNLNTRRQELDLIFLPINYLPDSSWIAPIVITDKGTKWQMDPSTKLYCYGYSKKQWEDIYPYCDTLITLWDSTFTNRDRYIAVYNPIGMKGSSGSPVFMKKRNRFMFIGVQFSVIPSENGWIYPEFFPTGYYRESVGFLISVDYLRDRLRFLLSDKQNAM